jgi:cold shock CspA family protein
VKNNLPEVTDVANRMAGALTRQQVDPNELSSCLATLRRPGMDGPRFFEFLDTVAREGRAVVRSGRTLDYYRTIEDACHTYLEPYKKDAETMAQILGWTVRLMRYYKVAGTSEAPPPRAGGPRRTQPAEKPGQRLTRQAQGPTTGAQTGTIKFFREDRGFGFIRGDDGVEIFVHKSAIVGGGTLHEGQQVSYDVGQGRKGPAAQNVQILG